MTKKVFVVIDKRALNFKTGLRGLVTEQIFTEADFEMIIEVTISGIDYVPVNKDVRNIFPVINRAHVSRLIVQF
jgi:hypothetical protein